MTPFLRQTASHYYAGGNLEKTCFIFPNRRSAAFFGKFLRDIVADDRQAVPFTAPVTTTISDFFYKVAGKRPTDRVVLLLDLYEQYRRLYPKAETLDEFIFWGDTLLADFDDIDKYLADPDQILRNVSDFKNIADNYSHLSETQAEAIRRFLGHFREGGSLSVEMECDGSYKARFLRIWDILGPLYRNFNSALDSSGRSYEGKVYRSLAESLDTTPAVDLLAGAFPETSRYVFVGLNALNECERRLLGRMRDAGVAEFCWDYSSEMIRDPHNKSSFFMSRNVADFPGAFRYDPEGLPQTEFNTLSVPSGVGQAKALASLLGDRPGIETAVVLPDEKMLIPVINSIPPKVTSLNVTMGYPMDGSELWSLVREACAMQSHMRLKDGKWHFYHRQVWGIFSNGVLKSVLSEQGRTRVENIKKGVKYYICEDEFKGDKVLEAVFRPVVKDSADCSGASVDAICEWLLEMLRTVAPLLGAGGQEGSDDRSVEMDFARELYLLVGRLAAIRPQVLPATCFKLISRLAAGLSVPFRGEPLRGLQIMGPLETRALDFDNIIILNCNEGMFPRRSVSSSFIPPELRKGFGLPTYEYQDAVWAYYFYRMIQRASKVWMVFDSRPDGLKGGEQSRYIRQLEMHFGVPVHRHVVSAPIGGNEIADSIPKTEEDIAALKEGYLSASSLQSYLACPARFYYHSVCRLRADDEVSESLDAGMIGNVFHKTMESLYRGRTRVTRADLEDLVKDKARVRDKVRELIMEELHTFEITGRNLIFEDVVCSYVHKALGRDLELLDTYGTDGFDILGLELGCRGEIGGYKFYGIIDRLDSFTPGEVRVVDYKTGKVTDQDFLIDDDNAGQVVEALFGPDNSKRPKIALQLYLYDLFAEALEPAKGKRIVNSIYQTSRLFVTGVENAPLSEKFRSLMSERMDGLLAEIGDTSLPWQRTPDQRACEYCDFKMICGR